MNENSDQMTHGGNYVPKPGEIGIPYTAGGFRRTLWDTPEGLLILRDAIDQAVFGFSEGVS